MTIIFHLLIATMFIAVLMLLRMFADHYVLRSRIRGRHTDAECEQAGCFRGCAQDDRTAQDMNSVVSHKRNTKRSVHHAY
jgi:quinol-cytochrome oxidoreductase complex cytochrome b subunit